MNSSDDDDEIPTLVSANNEPVPVTIITGYLGEHNDNNTDWLWLWLVVVFYYNIINNEVKELDESTSKVRQSYATNKIIH